MQRSVTGGCGGGGSGGVDDDLEGAAAPDGGGPGPAAVLVARAELHGVRGLGGEGWGDWVRGELVGAGVWVQGLGFTVLAVWVRGQG